MEVLWDENISEHCMGKRKMQSTGLVLLSDFTNVPVNFRQTTHPHLQKSCRGAASIILTSKALLPLKENRGWSEEEERTRDNAPVEKRENKVQILKQINNISNENEMLYGVPVLCTHPGRYYLTHQDTGWSSWINVIWISQLSSSGLNL